MDTKQEKEVKSPALVLVEENTKLALSSVEQNNKTAISMIHENMDVLIQQANNLVIDITSKEDYDNAIALKRTIKSTHVNVEKRRKELKAPFMEAGKKLDEFVKTIYTPLKNAEQVVKNKCSVYEKEQERLKEEKKNEAQNALNAEEELNNRLKNLNGYLGKINEAKTKTDITEIENYLENLDLNTFGDKSSDAGFIVTQLKMTCGMAKKLLPDEQIIETKPEIEPVPESKETVQDIQSEPRKERKDEIKSETKPFISREEGSEIRKEERVQVKDDNIIIPKEKMEITPKHKEHIDKIEKQHIDGNKAFNGELDFSTVADENPTPTTQKVEEKETPSDDNDGMLEFEMAKKVKFFTPDEVDHHLKSGVLPTAIHDGINEQDVVEVQFVDSVQLKPNDSFNDTLDVVDAKGLPIALTIQSVKPNGEVLIGKYVFQKIN